MTPDVCVECIFLMDPPRRTTAAVAHSDVSRPANAKIESLGIKSWKKEDPNSLFGCQLAVFLLRLAYRGADPLSLRNEHVERLLTLGYGGSAAVFY